MPLWFLPHTKEVMFLNHCSIEIFLCYSVLSTQMCNPFWVDVSLRVQPYPDTSNIMYCMRTLTRHSQRNYMKPMHYKIGVTCTRTQWTRVLYSVVITRQSYPPFSQFNSLFTIYQSGYKFTSVWSMFPCNIFFMDTRYWEIKYES